jgi:hypothetical protein
MDLTSRMDLKWIRNLNWSNDGFDQQDGSEMDQKLESANGSEMDQGLEWANGFERAKRI